MANLMSAIIANEERTGMVVFCRHLAQPPLVMWGFAAVEQASGFTCSGLQHGCIIYRRS